MEITVILGVRPHYVKASGLQYILKHTDIDLKFLDIHQHYDKYLREIYLKESGLKVINQSEVKPYKGSHLDEFIRQISDVGNWLLSKEGRKSKAIVVFGDANPAFASAIAGNRLGIPIIHIEAGVRRILSEKEHWNSLATDHLSSLRYCYTNKNLEELKLEGLEQNSYLVGDLFAKWTINKAKNYKSPVSLKEYVLVSIHRPQNCNINSIQNLCSILNLLDKKIIWILHPRIYEFKEEIRNYKNIDMVLSQNHLEALGMLNNASLIITDSGGFVREGVLLEKKVIVCHEQGMWSDLVENKAILRADMTKESLENMIERALNEDMIDGKSFFMIDGGEEIFINSMYSFLDSI